MRDAVSGPIVVLVIGPCGAGKTTWIAAHPWPRGWFAIQREPLMDAVQTGPRSYTPAARTFSRVLYWAAIDHAAARGLSVAIEAGGATRRERAAILDRFPAPAWHREIVAIVPADPADPIARAKADPLRPRTSRSAWGEIVANWYRRYEPVAPDEADALAHV